MVFAEDDFAGNLVTRETTGGPRIFAPPALQLPDFVLKEEVASSEAVIVPAARNALTQASAKARRALRGAPRGTLVALVSLAGVIDEFAGGTLVANRRRMSRDVLASGTAEALGVAAWFWRIGSVGAVARRVKKEERIKVQNYGTANTTTRMALTWKWVCV